MTIAARRSFAVLGSLLLAGLLGACSPGTVSDGKTPDEVMQQAKQILDETSGVHLALSTESLPDGVAGLKSAEGDATHAPAFDGRLEVIVAGQTVQVPVVAIDDVVYAKVPPLTGWQEVDPLRYQAPDPAELIGESGFSGVLTATEDLEEGESVRGGADNKEVLTEFTGSVPGQRITQVLPTATGDSYQATYQINADGQLRTATFTGVFYPDTPEMTYTVEFSDYGSSPQISAPVS